MSADLVLTRRALLQAAAALAVAPALGGCGGAPDVALDELPATALEPARLLKAWFGDGDFTGLSLLGEGYARRFDDDDALTADVAASLQPVASASAVDEATELWDMSVRADFDDDRARVVLGWVLARTELRLCALARALVRDGQLPGDA